MQFSSVPEIRLTPVIIMINDDSSDKMSNGKKFILLPLMSFATWIEIILCIDMYSNKQKAA